MKLKTETKKLKPKAKRGGNRNHSGKAFEKRNRQLEYKYRMEKKKEEVTPK